MANFKAGVRPSVLALAAVLGFGTSVRESSSAPSASPSTCFGTWALKTPLPTARSVPGAATLGGKLYVVGGSVIGVEKFGNLEVYDPVTNSWETKAPMPTKRGGIGFVQAGGFFYAFGGETEPIEPPEGEEPPDTRLATMERYDPATNTWTQKASMNLIRSGPAAASVNGKVYVFGAALQLENQATVEEYDPQTNSWAFKASMPTARHGCKAAVIGNTIYVIGGKGQPGPGEFKQAVEAYDVTTNTWSTKASIPTPRWEFAIGVINGKIYCAGGATTDAVLVDVLEVYDPSTNTWSTGPSMLSQRASVASSVVNNVLYACGGHTNVLSAAVEAFALDTSAPGITQPADIQVGCSVSPLVSVSYSATVTDNCDPNPTVVFNPPSGTGFPIGTTQVTVTATDHAGNSSSRSFNVIRASLSFTGFHSPIGGADGTGGSFSSPLKAFKLKSTIPVKFSASCGDQALTAGSHTLSVAKYSDETTSAEPIDATPQDAATTGNQFKLTDSQWHFNLDAEGTGMSKGIWLLTATLSDGSKHTVWIQIK